MAMVGVENVDELIKAQTQIWNHSLCFIKSMCLKSAIELGIPNIINNHVQPISLSDLVSSLSIHPTKTRHVFRLMRILVHSGFFSLDNIDGEERYSLTAASRLLLKDNNPFYDYTPFVSIMLDPILMKPFDYLSTWFKNDHDLNPFVTANGETLWEYSRHDPKFNCLVNESMACDSSLIAKIITIKCKDVFQGIDSLVDVGGGVGIVAKTIAESFPNINCIVLDQPHVVADLKRTKNLNFVGGDMFAAVPPADAFLFKWVLHDWADEDCVKILKNCKEAMRMREGKIIIIDMVLEDKTSKLDNDWSEVQLLFDMAAMVCVVGKQRNEKEWAKLFIDAGFTNYKIHHVLGPRALIEVYP